MRGGASCLWDGALLLTVEFLFAYSPFRRSDAFPWEAKSVK